MSESPLRTVIEVTGKELHLIVEMRKYEYGEFSVSKKKNDLILLKATGSIYLEDNVEIPYTK